jgi:Holliday junction resolvase-like predicted endonuclease
MREKENKAWYIGRRGELLAEEFLLELETTYVASLQQSDIGLDYVAFFSKDDGTPVIIAVEVKATEQEIKGRFVMQSSLLKRLRHLNVPVLIIVVDVKHNDIYFTWAQDAVPPEREDSLRRSAMCTISLRKATSEEKDLLKHEILNPKVNLLD